MADMNAYEKAMADVSRTLYQQTDPIRRNLLAAYAEPNTVPMAFNPVMGAFDSGMGGAMKQGISALSDRGIDPSVRDDFMRNATAKMGAYKSMTSADILDMLQKSAYTTAWGAPGIATEGFGKLAAAGNARDAANDQADAAEEAQRNQMYAQAGSALLVALMMCSKEIKENIVPVSVEEAEGLLSEVKVKRYRYSGDSEEYLGFIAEEMPDELKALDGKAVNLTNVIGTLVVVVKRLQERIADLEGREA